MPNFKVCLVAFKFSLRIKMENLKKNSSEDKPSKRKLEKVKNYAKVGVMVALLTFPKLSAAFGHEEKGEKKPAEPQEKAEQQLIEKVAELEEIFNKHEMMRDLLKELEGLPNSRLRFIFNEKLYEKGILGAFRPDNLNYLSNIFRGTIEITPPDKLTDEEDVKSFESTIYHEMVHVKQDYELWNYYHRGNPNNMPEWQAKYYFSNLPERRFRIGAEFEAYYKQIVFEKKELGEINKSTLAGFFTNYMAIQMTGAFREYGEIREIVSEKHEEVARLSGYTLEKFIESRGEK